MAKTVQYVMTFLNRITIWEFATDKDIVEFRRSDSDMIDGFCKIATIQRNLLKIHYPFCIPV